MDLRNCPHCNQVYRFMGRALCPDCYQEEERLFLKVREFLADNPKSSVAKVEAETGVPASRIIKWVREGRLVVAEGSIPEIVCEICGAPVGSGRFCSKCKQDLSRDISDVTGRSVDRPASSPRSSRRLSSDELLWAKRRGRDR